MNEELQKLQAEFSARRSRDFNEAEARIENVEWAFATLIEILLAHSEQAKG